MSNNLSVMDKILDLTYNLYHLTSKLPKEELYGLTSQIRRAIVSVGSNLMEGKNRGKKDFNRYIMISIGSCNELELQLKIVCKIYTIGTDTQIGRLIEIRKMLYGLSKKLTTEN